MKMKYIILNYFENKKWDYLFKYLQKYKKNYKIITDNIMIYELLEIEKYDISTLDETVPESGETVQQVYKNSKKWLEEYRSIFKDISFSNIEVFSIIDFKVFLQLHYLSRISKSIEQEKKPIIFILKRFFPIFYGIQDLLKSKDLELGIITKNKIELFNNENNTKNKLTKIKILNFLQSSNYRNNFLKNTKIIIKYALQLGIEKIKVDSNYTKNLKNSFEKMKKKTPNNINTIFFISGSREDLYIKPLNEIFKKFLDEKKEFIVITNNISTSIILSKNNIPHLNLDNDIRILLQQLKRSKEGKNIIDKLDTILINNTNTIGLKGIKNFLADLVLETCITIKFCEKLLINCKPKSIYAGLDGEILENTALVLAKQNKIIGYSMLPATTNPNPIIKEWFHAEKIFVAGTIDYKLLKNMGYEEKQLLITGNPKYDFLKKISSQDAKNKLKKVFDYDLQKKIILIAMSQWNENDEKWMSEYIQFCNENNYEIIIKIHPMYLTSNNELSEKKITIIKKKCYNNKYFITYDFGIYDLITSSDLVITDFSNVGIEAVLLKKPLLTVNFNLNPLDYIKLKETGAAIEIDDIEKLKEITKSILENKLYINKRFDSIIENYNYKNDGTASERIFQKLIVTDD